MFNKKILAVAIAAATTVGTIAQVGAMELSEKGLGQALIGPVYVTGQYDTGYKTQITVVNTRTDAAVKAKVVFRSHVDSIEVLDFILYLSPGDVWRGTVNGTIDNGSIYSNDDSMRVNDNADGIGGKGGDEADINAAFNTPTTGFMYGSTDNNSWGHVDVLGVYAVPVGTYTMSKARDYGTGSTSTVEVKRTMSKAALAALFDDIDDGSSRNTDYNKCTVKALGGGNAGVAGNYSSVSSISPCALKISGMIEVTDGATHRAAYTMHAMRAGHPERTEMQNDFFGTNGVGNVLNATQATNEADVLATASIAQAVDDMLVVANPLYNELRAANSHLAYNWGLNGGSTTGATGATATTGDGANGTRSNLQQYDSAIARDTTTWQYDAIDEGLTSLVVTFPTKYLHRQNTNNGATASAAINFYNAPCSAGADPSTAAIPKTEYYSYPFPVSGNVPFSFTSYDNSENNLTIAQGDFSGGSAAAGGTMNDEVNFFLQGDNLTYFSESTGGWAFVQYTNAAVAASGTCSETRFGAAVSYAGFPALSTVYKIGVYGRGFARTQDLQFD